MDLKAFFSLFVFVIVADRGQATCQNCFTYQTNIARNAVQDTVLAGHVISSIWGLSSPWECFFRCLKDCRCLSFNFQSSPSSNGSQLCELNSVEAAATDHKGLEVLRGFSYHDIEFSHFNRKVSKPQCQSAEPCDNKCCQSSPSQNGGTCIPICNQKRRIRCKCAWGFAGELCQRRAQSCADLLQSNNSLVPGIYSIHDGRDAKFVVFCDFHLRIQYAWTLVMSYSFANASNFKGVAFFKDYPMSPNQPNWTSYRLSKTRMTSIQSQSTRWRATCNYQSDGVVTTDYVRATFKQVNPLTYNQHACKKLAYVNIRGAECSNCSVFVVQDGDTHDFNVASEYGETNMSHKGCNFRNAPNAVSKEHSFGYYLFYNPTFRCVSSPNSTTQYWFGSRAINMTWQ